MPGDPAITPPPPRERGPFELLGVTTDDQVVYLGVSDRLLRIAGFDDGVPTPFAYNPSKVVVTGVTVFAWIDSWLLARTNEQIRYLANDAHPGAAAASADGKVFLYLDGAHADRPIVYTDSPWGQRAAAMTVGDPAAVSLRFGEGWWSIIRWAQQAGDGAQVVAWHPSGERVSLGSNIAGDAVIDSAGSSALMVDTNGYGLIRGVTSGELDLLTDFVSEGLFAADSVVYRTVDGVARLLTSAQSPATTLMDHVTALVATSADGAHALVERGPGVLAVLATVGAPPIRIDGTPAPGDAFSSDGRWVLYAPPGSPDQSTRRSRQEVTRLAAAPVAGGGAVTLSARCKRVKSAHDGILVFDDGNDLYFADGATGLRERRRLAAGVTNFILSSDGHRVVYTTADGLWVTPPL